MQGTLCPGRPRSCNSACRIVGRKSQSSAANRTAQGHQRHPGSLIAGVAGQGGRLPLAETAGRFKLDDLAVLQEAVEEGATLFAQPAGRLPWLASVSIASLSREAKQLGEVLKEIAHQKELAQKNSAAWERTKVRVVEVEAELKILRRLREYHVEPDAMSLLGSSAAVREIRAKVVQLKEAVTLLRAVDLKKFEECAATLDEMANQQEGDIAKRRRNLAKLRSRAAALANPTRHDQDRGGGNQGAGTPILRDQPQQHRLPPVWRAF